MTISFDKSGWNVIGDYIDQSDELTKKRDLKVLELKIAGKTNDDIAKEVGLQNKGTISKIITECKFIKTEMKAYLDNLFLEKKQNHEIAPILHIKPTSLPKLLFNCYGDEIPEFNINDCESNNCSLGINWSSGDLSIFSYAGGKIGLRGGNFAFAFAFAFS